LLNIADNAEKKGWVRPDLKVGSVANNTVIQSTLV